MKLSMRAVLALAGVTIAAACTKGADDETASLERQRQEALDASADQQWTCCAAACGPIFEMSFRSGVDDAALRNATLSVCRNAQCFRTSLADVELPASFGSIGSKDVVAPLERERLQAPSIRMFIYSPEAPGVSRRLSVEYWPRMANDWHDGDLYDLTLEDQHGTVLLRRETTVTYAIGQVCCQTCAAAIVDGGGTYIDSGLPYDDGGTLPDSGP